MMHMIKEWDDLDSTNNCLIIVKEAHKGEKDWLRL